MLLSNGMPMQKVRLFGVALLLVGAGLIYAANLVPITAPSAVDVSLPVFNVAAALGVSLNLAARIVSALVASRWLVAASWQVIAAWLGVAGALAAAIALIAGYIVWRYNRYGYWSTVQW